MNAALLTSAGWKEIQLRAGLYEVGRDIPAGTLTVSMDAQPAFFSVGSALSVSGNEIDAGSADYFHASLNEVAPVRDLILTEGMYLYIENAGVRISPSAGSPAQFN